MAAAAVESVSSLACWTCHASSMELCKSTGTLQTCPGTGSDGGDGGDGGEDNDGGDPEPTGSVYLIYPNAGLNFEDSQAACEAQGSYLIVPNTQARFLIGQLFIALIGPFFRGF